MSAFTKSRSAATAHTQCGMDRHLWFWVELILRRSAKRELSSPNSWCQNGLANDASVDGTLPARTLLIRTTTFPTTGAPLNQAKKAEEVWLSLMTYKEVRQRFEKQRKQKNIKKTKKHLFFVLPSPQSWCLPGVAAAVTGPMWGNFVDSGASRKWLLQVRTSGKTKDTLWIFVAYNYKEGTKLLEEYHNHPS